MMGVENAIVELVVPIERSMNVGSSMSKAREFWLTEGKPYVYFTTKPFEHAIHEREFIHVREVMPFENFNRDTEEAILKVIEKIPDSLPEELKRIRLALTYCKKIISETPYYTNHMKKIESIERGKE